MSLHESHLIHRPSAMWTRLGWPSDPSVLRRNHAIYLGGGPRHLRTLPPSVAPATPALEQVMTTLGDYNLTLSGSFNAAMKSPTSCPSVGESARSSIRRTMAEPTITPSATRPTAATWSGWPIPNPTQTGFVVRRLSVRICAARSGGGSRRSPVTPVNETT